LPALGLCAAIDEYAIFKATVRLASNAGVTPYKADKTLYLVSSGNFYKDGFKIEQHRDEFIKHARAKLL